MFLISISQLRAYEGYCLSYKLCSLLWQSVDCVSFTQAGSSQTTLCSMHGLPLRMPSTERQADRQTLRTYLIHVSKGSKDRQLLTMRTRLSRVSVQMRRQKRQRGCTAQWARNLRKEKKKTMRSGDRLVLVRCLLIFS